MLVPSAVLKPVAHELLVEARGIPSSPVLVGGPETRRVRGHALVDEDDLPVVDAEFKLGVGNDDAPGGRVGPAVTVEI